MSSSQLMAQLTASFGSASLPSLSDDEVFDESATSSPVHGGLPFSFHPSQLAQFHTQAGLQAQSQRHLQQQIQQQQQQQLLLQQRYPSYQAQLGAFAAQAAAPAFSLSYPVIDPLDTWLALSPYNQRAQFFDCALGPWSPALSQFTMSPNNNNRSNTRRKKSSSSSQYSQPEKKTAEEIDVATLAPRDAIKKAKVRLSNLSEWKAYTKNNTWTPEVVLGENFVVPITIKFIQLVPTANYMVSIGFALREDTPGLMSFSEDTMQWNSIEGAVHQAPRRTSPTIPKEEKTKVEMVLTEAPPANTIKLNHGKPMTGAELMKSPKEFTNLVVAKAAEEADQIVLRPYYKYSPCLYLSLLDDDRDHTVLFTRKVMIHDIKMVPVENLHNPMLAAFRSPSCTSSDSS